jgi:hypothetical protein
MLSLLLQPGIDQMVSLFNVDLTKIAGHIIHSSYSQTQVVLDQLKETGNFLQQEANRSGVVLGK